MYVILWHILNVMCKFQMNLCIHSKVMKHFIGLEIVQPEINWLIIVKMGDNFKGWKNTLKIIFQLGDTWFGFLAMLENVFALVSILY